MIIKFKKAKLKSILLITLFMILMALAVYSMTVTLNDPDDGVWWTSSNSVDHNFTPVTSGVETLSRCTIYSNRTGIWTQLAANYTTRLVNNTPHVSGISWVDTDNNSMGWNVSCWNGTDNIESGSQVFGVDAHPPTITLDSPDYAAYLDSGTQLNKYTPTDSSNPETCLFYTNVTGSWAVNQTNTSYVSGVQVIVNLSANANATIGNGNYIWNVICNDSADNRVWAETTNRTFTIDTVTPTDIKFLFPSNGSVTANITPRISWNQTTEINFEDYVVKVSTSTSDFEANVIQTRTITDRTDNETILRALPTNDKYFLIVTATDLAGNEVNTTSQLTLSIDSTVLIVTLNNPLNNTYTLDTTPIFNVTVVDDNPDTCILWLSNSSAGVVSINVTNTTVFNGTPVFLGPTTMVNGVYKFNIECNDSLNNRVNVSSSLLDLTIDTTAPSAVDLTITWGQTNNTDKTPQLSWLTTTETNFERYLIEARYVTNNTLEYSANVTDRTLNSIALSLSAGFTYNFSVTAYDLAGNSVKSVNTTSTWYYVDEICGTLAIGWNLCGATWTVAKNLSTIGSETSAIFVTIWNSSHTWKTCNYDASPNGANCDINVSVDSYPKSVAAPTGVGNVTVNVSGATLPKDTYFYRVSAISGVTGIESLASPEVKLNVSVTGNASAISWTAVLRASSYRVYNGTSSGGQTSYFETTNTSFNHSGQPVSGTGVPITSVSSYYSNGISSSVWIYVNESTEWRNRTWSATQSNMNITLTNETNGWNIIPGMFRNGRSFGELGRAFTVSNASLFSLPYINGSVASYVNRPPYNEMATNETVLNYGKAMWVHFNSTGKFTYDVGSW